MLKLSNTKLKGKRILAWLLAAALVAGTPGQAAYASEGDSTVPTAAEDMPEVLAHFDFENEAQICSPDSGSEATEAQGFVDEDEGGKTRALARIMPKDASNNASKVSGAAVGNGAADLTNDVYLDVVKVAEDGTESSLLSGHDALTISYYSQSSVESGYKWAYWAGPEGYVFPGSGKETILSMADRSNYLEESRWNNKDGRGPRIEKNDFSNTGWKQVTVVMDESTTTVYMNGVKIGSLDGEPALGDILGSNSSFYIGGAQWDNIEYFNGLIDEFTVYGGALTQKQVVEEYLKNETDADKMIASLKDYVDDQINAQVVKADSKMIAVRDLNLPTISDLNLPANVSDAASITWDSSADDVISDSGELKVYDGRPSTLTATISCQGGDQSVTDYEITTFDDKGVTFSQELKKFAASGGQSGQPGPFVAQKGNGAAGINRAEYKAGVTASKNCDVGSTRIGIVQFTITDNLALAADLIDNATLTVRVIDANGNLGSGNWTKAAVFETNNPDTWDVTETDNTASKIPAKNDVYSYDATMWSNERIYYYKNGDNEETKVKMPKEDNTEEEILNKDVTFDVTRALKNAVAAGKKTVVLRLQTVSAGYSLTGMGKTGQPALNVELFKKSDVTVKYVSEEGNELKPSKTIKNQRVGTTCPYVVSDDEEILTTEDGVYVRDKESNDNKLAVKVNRDSSQNIISVAYKKQIITEVIPPEDDIYVIAGNTPVFPAQLMAKPNVGTNISVDVVWPETIMIGETETAWNELAAGTYEVTGKVGTMDVTANLQVLECDEDVAAVNGGTEKRYDLKKAYKGKIVAEFDVEVTGLQSDMAITYTDKANGTWTGDSGPRIDFGTGGKVAFFRAQNGTGSGKSEDCTYYPAGTGGYDDKPGYIKAEIGKTYHVRMEIDDAVTTGLYRTYITEENGTVTKLFEDTGKETDGLKFRGWTGDGIVNFWTARGDFNVTNHKISWTSGWSKYTVNTFVNGNRVDTVTSDKEIAGTDHSAYKPEAIYKSEDGKKAFLNTETSGWKNGKSAAGDKETIVYNAYYETSEIASHDPEETIELTTRVGYAPELPETAKAIYENGIPQEEEVEWDVIDPSKYAKAGKYKATGKFKGTEVKVEASVTVVSLESVRVAEYNFDEDLKDAFEKHGDATTTGNVTYTKGLDGKAASLPGGKNAGYITLPDTLTTADENNSNQIPDDFTLSFFTKRGANDKTYAFSLGTKLENGTKPGPTDFFGLTNRDNQFQAEFKKSGTDAVTVGKGAATPQDEWVHIAVVAKGSTKEAWLYENGTLVKYANNVDMKMSDLTGGKNYIGYSPYTAKWDDPNYKGDVDKFAIYGADLTAAEIKDICNKTLYELQVQKTKEVLEKMIADGNFSYVDANVTETFNKDAVIADINLPTTLDDDEAGIGTTITWKSSDDGYVDDEGKVYQPSPEEGDKKVTLTATIKAGEVEETVDFVIMVKEGNELNFRGLKNAIDKAQAQCDAAEAKNIYTADSMNNLKGEIDAANVIAGYADAPENVPEGFSYMNINNARTALTTALNALKLKDLEKLDETALTAHYSLDEIVEEGSTKKVKDSSGNGHDGTVIGNVTATEADGASFPSSGALKDYINLPTNMEVTDQTTISFWMKSGEETTKNILGIGSIFGDKGGSSKHFYLSSAMNVFMTNNGWASGAHKGFQDVAFTKLAWHHVTAVLEGKTLTLYIDGQKIGTKDTDISIKDAWNAQGGTKYAYIGNSAYGKNGDKDFKGNIRDVRIYAASLEEAQVKAVHNYMIGEYRTHLAEAKTDIVTGLLGEDAEAGEDGTYSYPVPRTVTSLTLPKSGQNWESIKWQSNSTAINVESGAITLAETAKTVTLTATITVGNQTEDVIIKCLLPKEEADKTALQQAINRAEAMTEDEEDYTAESWEAMQAKLDAANRVNENEDATPTQVNDAKEALEEAISNLVPITKEALNTAIKNAEKFIEDETESKLEYPADKWTALESALADAQAVYAKADANEDEITAATETLTEATKAMKKTSVIEQETAKEELGTSLTTAETDVRDLGITEDNAAELASAKVWSDYAAALAAAQALDDKASKDELTTAKTNLDNALTELKETVQTKKDLNTAIAEASELTVADFEDDTAWETFQAALEAATTAVGDSDATSSSLKAALGTLNDALQAKKPSTTVTISLNKTKLSLKVGASATITADVTPADTKVEWSSDKKNIATVDKNGKVKAVAKGKAIITAKAGDVTATCEVTVTTVPVKKVKITESLAGSTKPAVAKGKKITLKATITPTNATNKKVKWSIDKKFAKYASISSKGVLSAKKAGAGKTVTVTATAQDGSKKKATIKVKIMKNAVTKITLKAGKKKVKAGKKITVKATVKHAKASKTLAWSIDKKSAKYASINSKGVLSAKKNAKGKTVTVTATATDGTKKKATIKIKITK